MKYLFMALILLIGYMTNAQNQLTIPSSISSSNISLTLKEGTTEFYPVKTTNTMVPMAVCRGILAKGGRKQLYLKII